MIGVGSLAVFLITVLFLGFDGVAKWVDFGIDDNNVVRTDVGIKFLFKKHPREGGGVNWLGIIAVFNIVVSSVGFFLFKDK